MRGIGWPESGRAAGRLAESFVGFHTAIGGTLQMMDQIDKTEFQEMAVILGRRGGIARGVSLRAGTTPVTGAAAKPPKPTPCARCGEVQPSSRAAWRHCRKKRQPKVNKV